MAAAEQAEGDDAVVADIQQFDVATVRSQVRPDAVQRLADPGADVFGMQAVDDQQAGDEFVRGERVQGSFVE